MRDEREEGFFEVGMIDPLDKDIDVDEIMEKIREELKRRGKLTSQETISNSEILTSVESSPSSPPINRDEVIEPTSNRKRLMAPILWKYGIKYKKFIKATPLLNRIAKKQHQRLVKKFINSSPAASPIYSSTVNIDNLPYYINYHGFLEQAKGKEGLKGIVKYHFFTFLLLVVQDIYCRL